ncbi:hypothetical protein KIN20_009821 [Parelaphostrongylus tenuis]|uniref:Histone-lysine N-methyltransferase, H3 lysine-79 specific n=1 Tax=Parelaphostrongylus tenuis TaxID=148309 RepID=A0AAD5MR25_PARTN|nr:hypothetical protein KIN20_009821 [Parelaphostrongylus tenuis]
MPEEQHRNLITKEAIIILLNNVCFDPSLDLHIKNLLADCREGTRIISIKSYATGTKAVNMPNHGGWPKMIYSSRCVIFLDIFLELGF